VRIVRLLPTSAPADDLDYVVSAGTEPTSLIASRWPDKAAATGRLPAALTALVGRERELTAIADLLARPSVRLLTLSGPGGIGKTRLALEAAARAADRFPDGATIALLAGVRDPNSWARVSRPPSALGPMAPWRCLISLPATCASGRADHA
jgi:hypothetical protein